jgi:hypothetical protein
LTPDSACRALEDLLPAANRWHLYHEDELYALQQKENPSPPKSCDIPLWALARDARYVLVVEAVSIKR